MRHLTGRYYFKKTWLGLVLMVEHRLAEEAPGSWKKVWSKARSQDLPYLKIRIEAI
jgi:hypothetical protein